MKRTSIKDVAKAAGVSITTVSKALNGYSDVSEKTKKKILQITEELHYAPDINARSLGGKAETTIALLVSELMPTNENGFVFGIISGLYHACTENGCEFMLLATTGVKQEKLSFLQLCRKKNLDGVVVSGLKLDDPYYKEILESDIPCVLIDMQIHGNYKCNVTIDNIGAASCAVQHLLEKGHRKIGLINGSEMADVSKQRFSGYALALLEAGILLDLDYVRYCNFSEELAFQGTRELLMQKPDITALFCISDLMAIGAIRAVESLKMKVPQDISVIGFDDMPLSCFVYKGISTIRQDPYLMGKTAGEMVCKILQRESVELEVKLPYEFISRSTVAERR